VLPAVPDNEFLRSPNAILLTDTKLRPWQHANPKDYATRFRHQSEEHCNLAFADDIDNRPPSILITTLAAHAYRGQENLGIALLEVIEGMPRYIDSSNGKGGCSTPLTRKRTSPTSGMNPTPPTAVANSIARCQTSGVTSSSRTTPRTRASTSSGT
jgi:hypothetical protein